MDDDFSPHEDQWRFLSGVRRVSEERARSVVGDDARRALGALAGDADVSGRDGPARCSEKRPLPSSRAGGELTAADVPVEVRVVRSDMVYDMGTSPFPRILRAVPCVSIDGAVRADRRYRIELIRVTKRGYYSSGA